MFVDFPPGFLLGLMRPSHVGASLGEMFHGAVTTLTFHICIDENMGRIYVVTS